MWSLEYNQVSVEEDADINSTASIVDEDSVLKSSSNGLDNKHQILLPKEDTDDSADEPIKKIELIKQMSKLNSHHENGLYNNILFHFVFLDGSIYI